MQDNYMTMLSGEDIRTLTRKARWISRLTDAAYTLLAITAFCVALYGILILALFSLAPKQ